MSPEPSAPPPGEDIHLPGPSLQPVLVALGVTLALLGITVSTVLLIGGIVLTVSVIVVWVRDTRREIDELPLEHHG